ncbi:SA1320 family protein [Staphylococcus argensis]|uniref:SA1320 family protein n=1 Tax=Staphylococcus argensis TaxID=1607738 RepID=UPI003704A2EC
MINLNKLNINDRDKAEIASFWVYQDINTARPFKVNGKKFKQVHKETDDKNNNQNGGVDMKVFELIDDNNQPTGKQVVAFQGTDSSENENSDNPFFLPDDWVEDIMLENDENATTKMLDESKEFYDNYLTKLSDAKTLNDNSFKKKYNANRKDFLNKSIEGVTGNSQGGASAKRIGQEYPDVDVITTDPARFPLSAWNKDGKPFYKNIIDYTSIFDILTNIQRGIGNNMPNKEVSVINGSPGLTHIVESHTGYHRKFNKKDNTYEDIPIKIKSVNDTEVKHGKKVPKTIEVKVEMDDLIPINVWTGESIAKSGNSGLIQLNLDNLSKLSDMVTNETSTSLNECCDFLHESYNIAEKENKEFGNRKERLSKDIKDTIELSLMASIHTQLEMAAPQLISILDEAEVILTSINQILEDSSPLPKLEGYGPIKENLISNNNLLRNGIETINTNLGDVIKQIFKNIVHELMDGVAAELMKHLKIVDSNIKSIKKQNDTFGKQIKDVKKIMEEQDATILDGNVNIRYSNNHMVKGKMEKSHYLKNKMSILNDHIDNGVKKIGDFLEGLYDNVFASNSKIYHNILEHFDRLLSSIHTAESVISSPQFKLLTKTRLVSPLLISSLKATLPMLEHEIHNIKKLIQDLHALAPLISGKIDDIVLQLKPYIVELIFSATHYNNMFLLNSSAQGRLDQMAQQFEVVVNGLNENEGEAIRAMDQSAQLLRNNMTIVKDQLEKLAVY